jgi:hypothetical protein
MVCQRTANPLQLRPPNRKQVFSLSCTVFGLVMLLRFSNVFREKGITKAHSLHQMHSLHSHFIFSFLVFATE